METTIFDFVSGVEMWKVTPSKSETVWSMFTGAALAHGLVGEFGDEEGMGD